MLAKTRPKPGVSLKYCGCCNPYVDLPRIARHLARVAETSQAFEIVSLESGEAFVAVILCGCPRACGNKPEVRQKAREALVVAGATLQSLPVAEADLPAAVERELIKKLNLP